MLGGIDAQFAPARDSVAWAKDAIREFHQTAVLFFKGDVGKIVTELDVETGEQVQKLRLVKSLPKSLFRKATEGLIHAKHAFDQATFAARTLTSGPSRKQVYFPWAENPTDLGRLLEKRGLDQRLWSTFAAHEPYPASDRYPGGDNVIRTLATMANHKHTVGLSVFANIASVGFPNIHGKIIQSMKVLMPRWDPVKNEAELIRWIGDIDVGRDYQFSFQIILQNSRLSQPVDATGALLGFADKAEAVIKDLQVRCEELATC